MFRLTCLAFVALAPRAACAARAAGRALGATNPIQKVVTLLGTLEAKINRDQQEEVKAYKAFMDWCKNGAKDQEFAIATAKTEIGDLTATIGKADSDLLTLSSKIEDLGGDIATNDADLKAAMRIREKEHTEFVAVQKEMVETVDTLERAINILERKMRGSELLQAKVDTRDIGKLVHVLGTIVDAAALSLHDRQTLIGLVQRGDQEEDDSMADLGAPDPAVYKTRSEGIVDVLEDLKQKAVTQLEQARREEANARHNFELLRQSLEDQIKVDTKALGAAKMTQHDTSETKATAGGDLAVTKKDLAQAEKILTNMKGDCMQKAADHETTVGNRAEELKALQTAKQALMEMTGAATGLVYNATSFLQVAGSRQGTLGLRTRADLANFEVVNLVRKLASEQRSAALAQLASRISNAMRVSVNAGEDPFAKVKALITDMLERLMKEAGQEAEHKAYCDKEYSETKQKISDLKYDVEKYSAKLDKSKADSVTLKDEVATLQREIAKLIKAQADADELRKEENTIYLQSKADLEQGLQGVRTALKILREYYAQAPAVLVQQPEAPELHSKASGSGTSIIGMLEVVEADFGKGLASTEMNEEASATAYEKLSMDNRISKATMEKDVEYKTKEAASLDKAALELTSDRDSAQTELDAVMQYSANIRSMCEAKPETYAERRQRREAEIAGLREALQILEGEAVLLEREERRHRRSGLRGAAVAPHRH